MLETIAGFFFQTAVSYPHRIPRPECGYAAGHGQHHRPPGRHGDHKVRLLFQLSSPPRVPAGAQQHLSGMLCATAPEGIISCDDNENTCLFLKDMYRFNPLKR